MYSKIKTLIKYLAIALSVSVACAVIITALVHANYFGTIPTKSQILKFKNSYATEVYASNGRLIGQIGTHDRLKVEFHEIPDTLIKVLLAVEDKRFYQHKGVDLLANLRALKGLVLNKPLGGGSTITQQLVKNMFGRDYGKSYNTYIIKLKEIVAAKRVEKVLAKNEILTHYLNTVPFGDNVYGIQAASLHYYNQSLSELKIEQMCVLVGLLKANTYYNPIKNPQNAKSRRNLILDLLAQESTINSSLKDSLQSLELDLDSLSTNKTTNLEYFISRVQQDAKQILKRNKLNVDLATDGLIIHTTLDYQLQLAAVKAMDEQLARMQILLYKQYGVAQKRDKPESSSKYTKLREAAKLHAGVIATNPNTGAILAYVGGIDYKRYPYDQIQAKRPMASLFKPVLYATAIENGLSPCSKLDNSELILKDFDHWNPNNASNTTGGTYTMASALYNSMNIPSIRLFIEQDFNTIQSNWKKMGFKSELQNKPSSALGTANASLYELASAYASFANGGRYIPKYCIEYICTRTGDTLFAKSSRNHSARVCSESTTESINSILEQAILKGTAKSFRDIYGLYYKMAAKTGTSQNYSDAWFVCYNSAICIATRVGANSPAYHFNHGQHGAASKLALPIAAKTIRYHLYSTNSHPYGAGLRTIELDEDCLEYKEETQIQKLFSKLSNNKSTIEKEKRKIKRRRNLEKLGSFFN